MGSYNSSGGSILTSSRQGDHPGLSVPSHIELGQRVCYLCDEVVHLDKDYLQHMYGPTHQGSQLQLCATPLSTKRDGLQSGMTGARGSKRRGKGTHGGDLVLLSPLSLPILSTFITHMLWVWENNFENVILRLLLVLCALMVAYILDINDL